MRIVGLADIHGNTDMLGRMADELARVAISPKGGGAVDECRVITL